MDLIKFLTRGEPIAGLDISDAALRLVLLDRKNDKQGSVYVKEIAEEPLEAETVQAGVLKDSAKFAVSLKKLLAKSGTKINYLIISLPQALSYSRVFYFPKVIMGEKLEDAMRAETQFSLPVDVRGVYLDWEKTGTDRNELFLTTIPKTIADAYINVFNSAKVQVIALETHLLSLIRALDTDHSKPTALIMQQTNGTLIAVVKDQSIRFSRLLPKNISEGELNKEMSRISNYYEVEDEKIYKTIKIGPANFLTVFAGLTKIDSANVVKKFADHGRIKNNPTDWLIAVGSALRGLLPRKSDNLISLLPLGTEQAYEYQKGLIFTKFIMSVVVSLSIFFALSSIAGWAFTVYLQLQLGERIARQSTEPLPPAVKSIEERVIAFNSLVSQLASAIKASPNWSRPLEALRLAEGSGITVTGLQAPSVNGQLTLQGIGKTRNDINLFKKNLDESTYYNNVILNISTVDIIKKENISFDITMRLRNPNQLYVR